MHGDDEGSWKNVFEGAGYEVTMSAERTRGDGTNPAVICRACTGGNGQPVKIEES